MIKFEHKYSSKKLQVCIDFVYIKDKVSGEAKMNFK